MALDSLLTRLKREGTTVSSVQPNSHAGLRCNGSVSADVLDVTKPVEQATGVTAVTAGKNHALRLEPAWNMACTAVTAVTRKMINAEVGFVETVHSVAADSTPSTTVQEVFTESQINPDGKGLAITPDVGTVRPPGLTPKLLAASMALDALIHAAGVGGRRLGGYGRNTHAEGLDAQGWQYTSCSGHRGASSPDNVPRQPQTQCCCSKPG